MYYRLVIDNKHLDAAIQLHSIASSINDAEITSGFISVDHERVAIIDLVAVDGTGDDVQQSRVRIGQGE